MHNIADRRRRRRRRCRRCSDLPSSSVGALRTEASGIARYSRQETGRA